MKNATPTAATLTRTPEQASVIAYTHPAHPGVKVQASPDCPTNAASRWSAFASAQGSALHFFAGKSFASQVSAEKAIGRWFATRSAA